MLGIAVDMCIYLRHPIEWIEHCLWEVGNPLHDTPPNTEALLMNCFSQHLWHEVFVTPMRVDMHVPNVE